jgi:hypothetical protein
LASIDDDEPAHRLRKGYYAMHWQARLPAQGQMAALHGAGQGMGGGWDAAVADHELRRIGGGYAAAGRAKEAVAGRPAMKTLRRVRNRQGRCYELAFKIMLNEPGAERFTLIHGRLTRVWDGAYRHAWIETGNGGVYDPVLDKTMPMDEYVRLVGPVVERRYTRVEMCCEVGTAKHTGPWHY